MNKVKSISVLVILVVSILIVSCSGNNENIDNKEKVVYPENSKIYVPIKDSMVVSIGIKYNNIPTEIDKVVVGIETITEYFNNGKEKRVYSIRTKQEKDFYNTPIIKYNVIDIKTNEKVKIRMVLRDGDTLYERIIVDYNETTKVYVKEVLM